MPVPYLNKLAKETGKSLTELEKLWSKAKKIASEHFGKPESKFGDSEFAYVTGIVKKMIGKEETLIVSKDTKIPGTNYIIKKGESFTFVDESIENIEEKTDWSRVEQNLLKSGLKFNKYGIWFNERDFELTRMYLSDEYTTLTFYNQKGFKSMFNGMEFPLLIVAEYPYPIKDINKERPDDIRIFDDIMDGYNYASHLDSDAREYSAHQNKNDFWSIKKQICENKETNSKDSRINEETEALADWEVNDIFKQFMKLAISLAGYDYHDEDSIKKHIRDQEVGRLFVKIVEVLMDHSNNVQQIIDYFKTVRDDLFEIVLDEDIKIPGTNVVIEKGDKIKIVSIK